MEAYYGAWQRRTNGSIAMDKIRRRRVLGIIALGAAIFSLLRRPTVMLASTWALYCVSERLFGVAPLKMYELGELVFTRPEATFAAASIVVAVASMLAFKRVKRLELELDVGSEIALVLKDGMDMMTRLRGFCVGVYELRQLLTPPVGGWQATPAEAQGRIGEITARWEVLKDELPQLRKDQRALWSISSRLVDIDVLHGVALRAAILAPFALRHAQRLSLEVAAKGGFLLPADDEEVGHYLDSLEIYKGISIEQFLSADEEKWSRCIEWLGSAASIGASSVARPSSITAVRAAVTVLRMRD